MPKYRCNVTREVTETAQVEVEAANATEANGKALCIALNSSREEYALLEWTRDDCEPKGAYIPDEDYAEEVAP